MDICKHSLCRISFSITSSIATIVPSAGANHQSFRIERETTERATEEVKYQQEQDCGDESRGIEHPTSTDSMIQRNVHDKEYREKR